LLKVVLEETESSQDFAVLKWHIRPRIFIACCTYSYTGYDG
jgi:hypothetical protein